MEWTLCVDLANIARSGLPPEEQAKFSGAEASSTELLHPGMHLVVGSVAAGTAPDAPTRKDGDFFDVAFSPNELLLFSSHHANLDRSAMIWQARAAAANASMVDASWRFPASPEEWPSAPAGCLLDDVLNAAAPFTSLFDTPPADAAGYTHREVLALTVPAQLPGGNAPYTYDNLEEGQEGSSSGGDA